MFAGNCATLLNPVLLEKIISFIQSDDPMSVGIMWATGTNKEREKERKRGDRRGEKVLTLFDSSVLVPNV